MLSAALLLFANTLLFSLRLSGGGSFPKPLTAAEEREWLDRYARGDPEARQVLIERNLRLVAHIIKKYYTQSADQEDLISIGTIGLIKGISSFDPAKGARLATYAARCIENAILSKRPAFRPGLLRGVPAPGDDRLHQPRLLLRGAGERAHLLHDRLRVDHGDPLGKLPPRLLRLGTVYGHCNHIAALHGSASLPPFCIKPYAAEAVPYSPPPPFTKAGKTGRAPSSYPPKNSLSRWCK